LSENIQIVANEPSLAFFRIQEHVRKTLPLLVDKKVCFIAWKSVFKRMSDSW